MPNTIHPGRTVVWNTPATVTNGVSNVSLLVRYPAGDLIPVAVPPGQTALQFAAVFTDPTWADFTVLAARFSKDGVTFQSEADTEPVYAPHLEEREFRAL